MHEYLYGALHIDVSFVTTGQLRQRTFEKIVKAENPEWLDEF